MNLKLTNCTSPLCEKEVYTIGPRLVPISSPVDPEIQQKPHHEKTPNSDLLADPAGQLTSIHRGGDVAPSHENTSGGGKDMTQNDRDMSIFKRVVRLANSDSTEEDTSDTFFDWSGRELAEFALSNKHMTRDEEHLPWMADQFYKLAVSLHQLFQNRQNIQSMGYETADITRDEAPTDLASSSQTDFLAELISPELPSSTYSTTMTYRAPEVHRTGVRLLLLKSDLYSMGCVFLEYITWFMMGEGEQNRFSDARSAKDEFTGFDSDQFFALSPDGRTATRKKEVGDWIRQLYDQPNCSAYLFELMHFIDDRILEPDPVKRAGIEEVKAKLRYFREKCRLSKSFYSWRYR